MPSPLSLSMPIFFRMPFRSWIIAAAARCQIAARLLMLRGYAYFAAITAMLAFIFADAFSAAATLSPFTITSLSRHFLRYLPPLIFSPCYYVDFSFRLLISLLMPLMLPCRFFAAAIRYTLLPTLIAATLMPPLR